jgi:hypothetical protein
MEVYPLLKKAEELIGRKHFDPILLLVLVIDEDVLKRSTRLGGDVLEKLQPLFVDCNKEALLEEARAYACGHLAAELSWRLASHHSPDVHFKSKKDELLDDHKKDAICPTIMQVVYRSGARRHCLARKFIDVIHVQMQDLLLEDGEVRVSSSRRPLQVLDFFACMQCT